ncbi:MAG: Chromate resistance protein ChrB [Janthinobacterium lividum]
MTGQGVSRRWLVLLVKVPAEPARYRMALWRELRRSGAVPLGQAVWAVPDLPAVRPLLDRLSALVAPADGSLLVLEAAGHAPVDAAHLDHLYAAAREAEWAELVADCGKFLDELDHEERIGKYTLAELEEEEQSLDRLRRWYRDLRARDLLGVPATRDAAAELKRCESRFDGYAERVYATLGQSGDPAPAPPPPDGAR